MKTDHLGHFLNHVHPPYGAIDLEVPLIHAFDQDLRLDLRFSLLFSLSDSLHWSLFANLKNNWLLDSTRSPG